MAQRKEAWLRGTRHALWNKQLFREEVEAGGGETIIAICRKWSTDPAKYQGLRNDIQAWRAEDPELDALCLERFGTHVGGGRQSLELQDPEWRQRYIEEYLRTKSRVKAAAVTPYSWESIRKKLEPHKSEYDPVFVEMLSAAESKLLDRAEEVIYEALEDPKESSRNRAWTAFQLLKVRDRQRYGDKIDISVTGSVQHQLDRGRVLAQLADSQQEFLDKQKETLALTEGEPVDAEVVDE